MNEDHNGAMEYVLGAASVTTLSYEEAIATYLRARGILRDGAKALADPIPRDWAPMTPRQIVAEVQQLLMQGDHKEAEHIVQKALLAQREQDAAIADEVARTLSRGLFRTTKATDEKIDVAREIAAAIRGKAP